MIDKRQRLITELLGTIYKESNNNTAFRMNITNAVEILTRYGYNIPSRSFENNLETILNKMLVGSLVTPGTKNSIAEITVELANKYHVPENKIIEYIAKNMKEQDPTEIQQKIKQWRKAYYGSLDQRQKEALLETLSKTMRPDVLDQIRRA